MKMDLKFVLIIDEFQPWNNSFSFQNLAFCDMYLQE